MGNSKADWVFVLLLFNTGLILFMGLFGQTFAEYETIEAVEDNALIPNFLVTLVVGFSSVPAWMNTFFALQGIFTIYLIIATLTGG